MDNKRKKTVLAIWAIAAVLMILVVMTIAVSQDTAEIPETYPKESMDTPVTSDPIPTPAVPLPAPQPDTGSGKENDTGGELHIDVMERPEKERPSDEPIVKDVIVIPGIQEEKR